MMYYDSRCSHPLNLQWKNHLKLLALFTFFLSTCSAGSNVPTFDFIVVGVGTSGCVIANRLSQSGKYTVLLVEEGEEPDPRLDIPAVTALEGLSSDPRYLQSYQSVPQKYAAQASNGIVTLIHGRTLGGGSALNGMWFNRGNPADFNGWANSTGDDGWRYENLLKYFKKVETYMGDFPSDQHGYHGPITVSRPKYAPLLDVWLQAGRELGLPVADPNGPQREIKNLEVLTNATVRKIVFDGNKATGIIYSTNSSSSLLTYVRVRKEIVLSAGVIGSPMILMRSGIGPKHVLEAAKITPVKHLPVGLNLQDHLSVNMNFIVNNRSEVLDYNRDLNSESWKMYNEIGDGPYSSQGQVGQNFIVSSLTRQEDGNKDWPDIQQALLVRPSVLVESLPSQSNNTGIADWEGVINTYNFVARPRSVGSVSLNTTNADGPPVIDFQFLTHPRDREVLLEGIKMLLKIFEDTPAFKKLGARLPPLNTPACRHLRYRSDDYWRCYIAQTASGGAHGAGTCKMGSGPGDVTAVVDSNLRVIGMTNLRVADASIMPKITNANLQAPVYTIGEKASDLILKAWERS